MGLKTKYNIATNSRIKSELNCREFVAYYEEKNYPRLIISLSTVCFTVNFVMGKGAGPPFTRPSKSNFECPKITH